MNKMLHSMPSAVQSVMDRWDPTIKAAESTNNTIDILDIIGEDFFGEGFTAKRMSAALRSIGDEQDIIVNINSPGGNVDDGIAIYEMLKNHSGQVNVRILSMAASIATVIALAGDTISMSKYGTFMVHDPWMFFAGNSRDFAEASQHLEQASLQITQLYADKTGLSPKQARAFMQAGSAIDGTYFTAELALEYGFVDSILSDDSVNHDDETKNYRRIFEKALKQNQPDMTRAEVAKISKEIFDVSDSINNGVSDSAAHSMSDSAEAQVVEKLNSLIQTLKS